MAAAPWDLVAWRWDDLPKFFLESHTTKALQFMTTIKMGLAFPMLYPVQPNTALDLQGLKHNQPNEKILLTIDGGSLDGVRVLSCPRGRRQRGC